MNTLRKKGNKGFTIIELMIVLVIVAILLAIAYPSYVNYTRKAKRGEAQQLLMNWAINQEIFRSNNTAYASADPDGPLPPPVHQDGLYTFSAYLSNNLGDDDCGGETGVPNGVSYVLYAVAQGDQANDTARNGDTCATLCLSSSGPKQPAVCWD